MFSFSWMRSRSSKPQTSAPSRPRNGGVRRVRFRPAVELLEGRTLPAAGPATHLQVITPSAVDAGSPAPVEVIALDASNNPAFSYTGTVHFTSNDSAATLPADYAFTAKDHGVHFFQTTFMTTGSRNIIERIAQAIVVDRHERPSLPPNFAPSPLAEVVLLSDLWSEIGEVKRTIARLSGSGSQGHVVQIVDPAEETFPYWGRVEFIEPENGARITAGRAENWRADYTAELARHRAAIRNETDRLGWSFTIHRTDRPATELLLALHSRIGAGVMGDLRRPHATGRSGIPA